MIPIDPIANNYHFEDQSSFLLFEFPAKKRFTNLHQLFMVAFITGIGYIFIPGFSHWLGPYVFERIFLFAWVFSGLALLLLELFWFLIGKESVEVYPDLIRIRHEIFGIGRWEALGQACAVFKTRSAGSPSKYSGYFDFSRGEIAIDLGRKFFWRPITIRFGGSLPACEAEKIVALIHQRFPQYMDHPSKN